jgi:HD superfamily phosphohydrolase
LNKKKIINDPIYGFITIPDDLIFDIIDHPYFQRLRRIKQLGLTDLVYPGALHTRFHHALGAMHLMGLALTNLRSKGHEISDKELQAAQLAVLLHDIGHGPFSHALEYTLLSNTSHEQVSSFIISALNKKFNGALELALNIFEDTYERKFLHQLVSSQLDTDRLDYLQRDCFFTGVSEGTIGADRIIKMLEIVDDKLVVEEKGIYSIENFLTARRLMYWQVYLHKTTVSAEKMMIKVVERAKYLVKNGETLFGTEPLLLFLKNDVQIADFYKDDSLLKTFIALDDYDLWAGIKAWVNHPDKILSFLSRSLLERRLFKIELTDKAPEGKRVRQLSDKICAKFGIDDEYVDYLILKGSLTNAAYIAKSEKINILTKKGQVIDVSDASDLPSIKAISKIVKKHYLCWPKNVYL